MRLNRIAALTAGTALSAGFVLAGAGAAQAQSLDLGSLGSSGQDTTPALELAIAEANPDGVKGTVTALNVDDDKAVTGCGIAVSHADVVAQYEAYYNEHDELPGNSGTEWDALQDANAKHQNWLAGPEFDDELTVEWTGKQGEDTAAEDYRAGAFVQCDYDGKKLVAFAYEPTNPIADFIGSVEGFFGNIFDTISGSLGSSGPADDDDNTNTTATA